MKILWLCNIELPCISKALGHNINPLGGWMVSIFDLLIRVPGLAVCVCFPTRTNKLFDGSDGKVRYYSFKLFKDSIMRFEDILVEAKPDIIHIFGTEFRHSLDMIKACEKKKLINQTIVSIQGLIHLIGKHYYSDIPSKVIHKYSFHDFIRHSNIYWAKKKYEKRGKYEIEVICRVKHIIGRTEWDYAVTKQINSSVNYHFCNETLRTSFYNQKWKFDECEKYSIFISQANYPIKGLHILLEALSVVKDKYPCVHLYVAGKNFASKEIKSAIMKTRYDKYIYNYIKQKNLSENISFLGTLEENEMLDRYMKSNVFVICSSIENSPNSLGEAMILGVPSIASDVGGIRSMFRDRIDGYIYPFNESYMLAYYICKIFDNIDDACKMSENAKKHAMQLYDKTNNLNKLLSIYRDLLV